MPELPEVETIKLALSKKIIGSKIKQIQVLTPNSFQGDSKQVLDKRIINIWRRAKVLGIGLESKTTLLIHLKMSGQLILISNDKRSKINTKRFIGGHPTQDMHLGMPNKSTRVILELSDGSKIYFNDQRKFGWIKSINNEQLTINNLFSKFGPEPLEKEFTWQILKDRLIAHKTLPVKTALLDQTIVSGIGNIYASEACFIAGIDPRKKALVLTDTEIINLHKGIVQSLQTGIKHGGSSKTHFVDPEGNKGYFLDYAFVYGKDKKPCKICKTPILKIQLNGRGTYFCPKCQVA